MGEGGRIGRQGLQQRDGWIEKRKERWRDLEIPDAKQ